MSILFNRIEGMVSSGHGAHPKSRGAASVSLGAGLPISPQRLRSSRAELLARLTLLLIGLGFFAATTLFIVALITVILA